MRSMRGNEGKVFRGGSEVPVSVWYAHEVQVSLSRSGVSW
jgi:hypothetical protein